MLRIREIASATLLRFLPSVTVGTVALTAWIDPGPLSDISLASWLFVGRVLLQQSAGFGLTLFLARHRLGADAAISGPRTALVGALGTALLLAIATVGAGFIPSSALWLVAMLTGAAASATMFWPWLKQRMSERELTAWETVDLDALAAADALRAVAPQPASTISH